MKLKTAGVYATAGNVKLHWEATANGAEAGKDENPTIKICSGIAIWNSFKTSHSGRLWQSLSFQKFNLTMYRKNCILRAGNNSRFLHFNK